MSSTLNKLFRTLLPVLVIALAILGAVVLVKTRSRPKPRPEQEVATLVTVEPLQKTSRAVVLETTGTVIPAQSITLQARVGGEVLSMSEAFLPGGRFQAGEPILKLDPEDYKLTLALRESELAQARLSDAQEKGMQTVARHEWELLDAREGLPQEQQDLILRKPHLEASAAALEGAEASVRQARLNLERTEIRAPFDAVVLSHGVDVGAQVSAQTALGTLAGTDEYWVEATLAVRDLKWLDLPAEAGPSGSPAVIRLSSDDEETSSRAGTLLKLDAQLEANGRLARVLVSVPNPLSEAEGRLPLLLGAHVSVELEGPMLENVFVISRGALQDGRYVWLMNSSDRLEVREVDVVWSNADIVIVREGLQEGDRLIVSDLAVPVPEMLLTTKISDPRADRSEPPADRPGPPAGNPEE